MSRAAVRDLLPGAVLDVETAPAAELVGAAGPAGRNGHGRPALHRIVCASVLSFGRDPRDGAFRSARLRTFTADGRPESAILVGVDLTLPDPADARSRLVTWNGGFDLRMLRARAVALWMTELHCLRGWTADVGGGRHLDGERHLDLMREDAGGGRGWWRLADICAGMGIPLHRGARTMTRSLAEGRWDEVASHNRLDVLATLVVHGARESFRTGCPVPGATAWLEAARLARDAGPASGAEAAFADHALVGLARRRLESHDPAACGCAAARLAAA